MLRACAPVLSMSAGQMKGLYLGTHHRFIAGETLRNLPRPGQPYLIYAALVKFHAGPQKVNNGASILITHGDYVSGCCPPMAYTVCSLNVPHSHIVDAIFGPFID
jgi:hypothetical protein